MTRWFWLLLVGALLLRIGLVLFRGPPAPPHYADTFVYYSTAEKLTEGTAAWLERRSEFGYRAPLYFAFLAGALKTAGAHSYRLAQVATALLGVACAALIWVMMRRHSGPAAAGWSSALRAFLPTWIIADTFVMSEPLFAFLQIAAVFVLLAGEARPSRANAGLLGVLLGLCVLTRESAAFYLILFAPFLLLSASDRWPRIAVYAAAALLTVSPWLVRNQVVWGRMLPLSYSGGVNLHVGYNDIATGGYVEIEDRRPASVPFGGPEAARWHGQEALRFARQYPRKVLALVPRKLAFMLAPAFNRDELIEIYRLPRHLATGVAALCGGVSALLLLLGWSRLALLGRDRLALISALLLAYYLLLGVAAFGSSRFRDPADNLLACQAGLLIGTGGLGPLVRSPRAWTPRWRLLVWLGGLVCLVGFWVYWARLKMTGGF